MSKIAAVDNQAMNTLYRAELARTGSKIAADEKTDAFTDHKEYESLLESVLSDDGKETWNPNDPLLD